MARHLSSNEEAADRWRVLAACTIGNAVSLTPAIHSVFGLFLVPLSNQFGWSRASISAALAVMAITCAISYPVAGRWTDRHGARRILIVANILFALSIASLALMTDSIWHFYCAFLLVSLFGSWVSTPIFAKLVSDWFGRQRGVALGISAGFGNGVGSVAFPVIAALVVSAFGWRAGYAAIGLLVLVLGFPALLLLLRDRGPRDDATRAVGAAADLTLAEAIQRPQFWLILLALASGAGCTTAIFSHVVPILGDRGIDVAMATAVVSVFALVTSAWQVATGRILDRIETPRIVVPMYAMAIAGLALIELGSGTSELLLAGTLLGIGLGAQYAALPYFISRYFGLQAFGAIIGAMYSAVIIAQGITPVLLDAAFDVQGTYRYAIIAAGLLLAVGAALILLLPPYRAPVPAAAPPGGAWTPNAV
jgi:MFS family permease